MCSWAMGSGSTNMMVRSDCVLTLIWLMTHTPRSEKDFAVDLPGGFVRHFNAHLCVFLVLVVEWLR